MPPDQILGFIVGLLLCMLFLCMLKYLLTSPKMRIHWYREAGPGKPDKERNPPEPYCEPMNCITCGVPIGTSGRWTPEGVGPLCADAACGRYPEKEKQSA